MILLLALTGWNSLAYGVEPGITGRQMAITLDDLPAQRAPELTGEPLEAMTDSLLSTLADYGVPAVGFVNEGKLYSHGEISPDRVEVLTSWLEAGFELGNHTFSHPDLHKVPLTDFRTDVLRGQEVVKPLAAETGTPYRYFRHPFLHTGLDLKTKTGLEAFLARHEYVVAPVTVDNSEWIFARAFDEALGQDSREVRVRLGHEYVDYMVRMVAYYEDQSRALFGREIPQVLLVHANGLNAHYLGSLLEALSDRGYTFIDLETALADDAYSSPDTYVGSGGITWIHRWALTRGVERGFFDGEPRTPGWVQDLAGFEE